jgi:heptosyltransferase-2
MKILIIALSGIGDALMFTPALYLLKEEYPDSDIEALVMFKGVEEIYNRLPQITRVHYYDFLNSRSKDSYHYVRNIRNQYDISINVYPSNRWEYNSISYLIGSKKRAAVKYLRKGKRNLHILNNILVNEKDDLHNVEENVALVQAITKKHFQEIPDLQFPLTVDNIKAAEKYLLENQINKDDLIIGFHPGCATLKNHIKRRWEPEKFAELANRLIENRNAKVMVFGGQDEEELKNSIVSQVPSDRILNVSTDSITETAAIMKRCDLFITNDSSLMHIAAALKLKVVALIGPTNTSYIKPWNTKHKIVSLNLECAPCFYYSPKPLTCERTDIQFKCIKELDVNNVLESVESFIAENE